MSEAESIESRFVDAIEEIAKNGRDANRIAGYVPGPAMSERDKIRSDAWLRIYCSALNCVGVNSSDAKECANKGLAFFDDKFLNTNF